MVVPVASCPRGRLCVAAGGTLSWLPGWRVFLPSASLLLLLAFPLFFLRVVVLPSSLDVRGRRGRGLWPVVWGAARVELHVFFLNMDLPLNRSRSGGSHHLLPPQDVAGLAWIGRRQPGGPPVAAFLIITW